MYQPPKYTLYFECLHCRRSWEEKSDDELAMSECEECGRLIDEPTHAFPDLGISI